jgi:methyl-accepting chemotaxis protein
MTRLMSRLSIQNQIGLIAALGVIGLMTLGAVYLFNSDQLGRMQARLDASRIADELLNDIEAGMFEAREREKEFLLHREEAQIGAHATATGAVTSKVQALSQHLTDPDLRGKAEVLGTAVASYAQQFAKAGAAQRTLGLDPRSGLIGALSKSAEIVEKRLDDHDEIRLSNLILMMRRFEKDFLLTNDPQFKDKVLDNAREFAQMMTIAKLSPAMREDVSAKIAAYQRDFTSMVEGTIALQTDLRGLNSSYAGIQSALPLMTAAIRAEDQAVNEAMRSLRSNTSYVMYGTIIGITLLVAVIGLRVGRGVSRPIAGMTAAMQRLAGNDTTVEIPGVGQSNEIGAMAQAVLVFKDNMIRADALTAEQKTEQARKEERQQVIADHIHAFEKSIGGSLQTLATASKELDSTAHSMSATADETNRKSTAAAAASEQASVNVQTVASAAEQLSASISEISRQVAESTRVAGQAVTDAQQTNSQVQALAEAAQKIGAVVKLINDIAGQTNLLALNATIEAARAGEAGKGFAVVASEVKSLATQTAKATEDIAAQVNAIQGATGGAVQAIQHIGETIGRVSEIAAAIASAVEEQGAATKEIARNVQQASAGTTEVSSNIAGVTKAATETGQAANYVQTSAGDLAKQGQTLRTEVDNFLANIRAA